MLPCILLNTPEQFPVEANTQSANHMAVQLLNSFGHPNWKEWGFREIWMWYTFIIGARWVDLYFRNYSPTQTFMQS